MEARGMRLLVSTYKGPICRVIAGGHEKNFYWKGNAQDMLDEIDSWCAARGVAQGTALYFDQNVPDGGTPIRILEPAVPDTIVRVKVQADPINHPPHYGGDTTYEAIKVIEAWDLGFRLGSTLKYICRAGKKSSYLEDLRKARWYLDREIATMEQSHVTK